MKQNASLFFASLHWMDRIAGPSRFPETSSNAFFDVDDSVMQKLWKSVAHFVLVLPAIFAIRAFRRPMIKWFYMLFLISHSAVKLVRKESGDEVVDTSLCFSCATLDIDFISWKKSQARPSLFWIANPLELRSHFWVFRGFPFSNKFLRVSSLILWKVNTKSEAKLARKIHTFPFSNNFLRGSSFEFHS